MVKWLHLAGGYGHLQYRSIHWQPVPIDRAIHVEVEKVRALPKAKAAAPRREPVLATAASRR